MEYNMLWLDLALDEETDLRLAGSAQIDSMTHRKRTSEVKMLIRRAAEKVLEDYMKKEGL